jgi:hypothetical protein
LPIESVNLILGWAERRVGQLLAEMTRATPEESGKSGGRGNLKSLSQDEQGFKPHPADHERTWLDPWPSGGCGEVYNPRVISNGGFLGWALNNLVLLPAMIIQPTSALYALFVSSLW